MDLGDNLFNWLQMHLVSRRFPDDIPARETEDFFFRMLQEDHHVNRVDWEVTDDAYIVTYTRDEQTETKRIDRPLVEKFLSDLEKEPRYRQ